MSMKNFNDNNGNRTRDPLVRSAVLQPTLLPRAPQAASTHSYTAKCTQEIYFKPQPQKSVMRLFYIYIYKAYCKAGPIVFVWKNVDSVVFSLLPSEFYSSISSSNRCFSPA